MTKLELDNLSFEDYVKVIYTKEELEFEYKIFKQHNPEPDDIEKYVEYAAENNRLAFLIRNYEILNANKFTSLINYEKLFLFEKGYMKDKIGDSNAGI